MISGGTLFGPQAPTTARSRSGNSAMAVTVSNDQTHEFGESSGKEGLRGCFVVLSAVEMLPADEEVSARISRLFRRLQDLYAAAIIRAQALGEINPGLDERTLARFLVCQIQGMRVLGKAGADRDATRAMVDFALKPLG